MSIFSSDLKRFLKLCLVLCLAIIAGIFGLSRIYDAVNPDYDMLYRYQSMPDQIQIANLGSSHGFYGFCYEDLSVSAESFNFAFSGQKLSTDYYMFRQFADHMVSGSILYIPISYFSFYEEEDEKPASGAQYYKILSQGNQPYYNFYDMIKSRYFSILAENDDIPDVYFNYSSSRVNDWWNSSIDPAKAVSSAQIAYAKHFASYLVGKDMSQTEIDYLQKIINLCKEYGVQPVLVTTPFLSEYRSLVSEDFLCKFEKVISQFTSQGILYYDYSNDNRFSSHYDLFLDVDHLNKSGAKLFTDIIYQRTIEDLKG